MRIDHALGATEIPAAAQRVLTWGWVSTEAAIALGVVPVAMPHQAYGGDDEGVLPWVRERLEADGAEMPKVLPRAQEPPIEAIAAARPDLLATDESTFYFTLSKERLAELESDVLVAHAETQAQMDAFLRSDYARQLPQVRRGSVTAIVGAPFVASVSPPNALSLLWGLEEYVEILSRAAKAAEGG